MMGGGLKAVCTFGKPASPNLCSGICGAEYKSNVYELNRLCRVDDYVEPLSKFVAWCLRKLKSLDWIIVSYSDTAMNHHGYIYQSCNFLYTGATKKRTDMYTLNGKHSRHYNSSEQTGLRKALKYPIMNYPKGNNSNYILGDFLKDEIVEDKRYCKTK